MILVKVVNYAINYAKPSEAFELSSGIQSGPDCPGRLLDLSPLLNLLGIEAMIGFPCLRGGTTVGADRIVKNISLTQSEWTEDLCQRFIYRLIFIGSFLLGLSLSSN